MTASTLLNAKDMEAREARTEKRATALYDAHRERITRRTDHILAGLLLFEWLAGMAVAAWVSPRTWAGPVSQVHFHLWMAFLLGGALSFFPVALVFLLPGKPVTRHAIAIGQMLQSALLIHLTGGRIETHFHVFGSLAILAFYRDWRVLISATVVVAGDHFLRGIYMPRSVYGVLQADGWRWVEHAGWVVFEDVFLIFSCVQGLREMRDIAVRQAQLEESNEVIEAHAADANHAKEMMRIAKEAAEQANEAKSTFLSRMSHELRTPLNSILGFGQLIEMGEASPRSRANVDHILKAGRHLLGLINEVLDISRVESGNLSLSLEPVSVHQVVQEAIDLVQHLATRNKVWLDPAWANAELGYVIADRQRLKQVILNILSNAVKYNREGGSVTVKVDSSADRLTIRIADTGIGIRPEALPRLFTPFDRLDAEKTGVDGTGLGLALSKVLVDAMHGTLDVRNLEEGSEFSVGLPVAENAAETLQRIRESKAEIHVNGDTATRTVLYVEDNLENLELVETILECRPGIKLVSAMQGGLGVEMAHAKRPHLALLDLNLPDMSGLDVLRKLQEDPVTRHIPVVMISADATPGQARRLLNEGARAYLTKPIEVKEFLEVVDEALEAA